MKTQKNSKLEKILSSAKQKIETIKGAGARAREIAGSTAKFFKDNYRVRVMIGAGVIGGYVGEKANAEYTNNQYCPVINRIDIIGYVYRSLKSCENPQETGFLRVFSRKA